ncbi:MAG: ribonuclease III domain-containing protein [Pseudanabaenaceae cyanobacterium bins.68]|nr:ribonuclease III domain-containing protein [Pseudanabaenaceae cyanobacterium bins.68]
MGDTKLSGQLSPASLAAIPPTALAYLGDAIYELHIRQFYLLPNRKINDYHQLVVSKVRAESQAQSLQRLIDWGILTDLEQSLIRRGRNAAGQPSRHLNPEIYQKATAFEVLIAYLYLSDRDRYQFIMHYLDHETENQV